MTPRNVHAASICVVALLAGGLTFMSPSAHAAALTHGSVTATAAASVTILAPETLSATQQLTFGAVIRPANGQANTVRVDTDDKMTITGRGDAKAKPGAVATAGVFEIAGPANTVYALDQSLRVVGAGLRRAVASPGEAKDTAARVLPASGLQQVRFGGAFTIDPTAPPGRYDGYLAVTVNYN
jgi:hypothetical protein